MCGAESFWLVGCVFGKLAGEVWMIVPQSISVEWRGVRLNGALVDCNMSVDEVPLYS